MKGRHKGESGSSCRLIQVYGFPHCGTSIVRKIVGNHSKVLDIPRETAAPRARHRLREASRNGMIGVVAKTVERGRIDLNRLDGADRVLLVIRNPEDVVSSLLLRAPSGDPEAVFESWLLYASDYLIFENPRVKRLRYEDLFDSDWATLREVFAFLGLEWDPLVVEGNSQRRVPIHFSTVPEVEPDRRDHEAFRSWQINQDFIYMGGQNRHLVPIELRRRIRKSEAVAALGYTDGMPI